MTNALPGSTTGDLSTGMNTRAHTHTHPHESLSLRPSETLDLPLCELVSNLSADRPRRREGKGEENEDQFPVEGPLTNSKAVHEGRKETLQGTLTIRKPLYWL